MGDVDRAAARAGAHDVAGPPCTVTVRVQGFVDHPVIVTALRRFDAAIQRDPTVQAVVLDVLDIEGFEPGVPARLIQWLAQNAGQVRAAALVTMSPVLLATVRASELLLPNSTFTAAPTRAEAQSAARDALEGRTRTSTGVRRTRPPTPPNGVRPTPENGLRRKFPS
jgi:hypothetical protein